MSVGPAVDIFNPSDNSFTGVTSLNGLIDSVTISAGTGIILTPSGNDIQISAPGAAGDVVATGTLTNHAIVLGSGTTSIHVLASLGTSNTVLHGNAAGDPSFSAVSLTADISGVLPIANGGTGVSTFTQGSVIFAGATTLAENNARLSWDDTAETLSIGGGVVVSVAAAQTSNYTTLGSDFTIPCDPTGAGFTVTLSNANGKAGQLYIVKNVSDSTNTITLSPSSGLIDGAASYAMNIPRESIMLQLDDTATNWMIV